jgi:glycine/D-amino acid oxidase-like deaminating enzyme
MGRASYANQARVHRGYHYPRSLLTASRSRANYDRFLADFGDCVEEDLASVYAVSRVFSNVTASQFLRFSRRIGAPLEKASSRIRRLFDLDRVEEVFLAREAVFDALKLRERVSSRLSGAGVEIRLDTEAIALRGLSNDTLEVSLRKADGAEEKETARHVFLCTYSRLNHLLVGSGLTPISLKHELAELALVSVPEPLRGMSVTLMCGPFFSVVPFPPRGLHTLSHVRYTPQRAWQDDPAEPYRDPHLLLASSPRRSRHLEMVKDASRYLPLLAESAYVESIWETKCLLPRSEVDDGRPILFMRDCGLPGLHCVMGSKIDNVYDMMELASRVLARA